MIIAGYIASALIGISLGLIGGGGSILTVPVMVYLFNISPTLATSYSLFVVGSTSLVGAYTNHRKGLVNIKIGLLFGLSSITTVFLTRKFLIPIIPQTIPVGHMTVSRSFLTMVLFAVLMLPASLSMIKNGQNEPKPEDRQANPCNRLAKLLFYWILVGIVTGLLGACGGLLLITTPGLV